MGRYLIGLTFFFTTFWSHTGYAQNGDRLNIDAEWRTSFMATEQYEDLQNNATLASGGNITATVIPSKNIRLVLSLYGSQKIAGTDLTIPDPTTGRYSRFELGMYDVTSPDKKSVLLVGQAHLAWLTGMHHLKIGRFKLKTPYFNPQDGRMIPTLAQGVEYSLKADSIWAMNLRYLNAVAPRSTHRWYLLKNSMGLYPQGRTPEGNASNYGGNLNTSGLAILNASYKKLPAAKLNFYHYYLQNVFHLSHLEISKSYKPSFSLIDQLQWQLQGVSQFGTGNGGNKEPAMRYINPKHQSFGFGGSISATVSPYRLSLDAFRITARGRMLFPREWGRDPYFTFQAPERIEGQGDTRSVVGRINRSFKPGKLNINTSLSYGVNHLTDPSEPELNKYAMPSYRQINAKVVIQPDQQSKYNGALKILWAYKSAINPISNPNFIYNKVNLHLFHLSFSLTL